MILPSLRCSRFTMEVYKFYANSVILSGNLKWSCGKGRKYSVISLRQRKVETQSPSRIQNPVSLSYPMTVSPFFWITWTVLMPATTPVNCQFLILLLFKKRILAENIWMFMVRHCFHLSDLEYICILTTFLTNKNKLNKYLL